MGQKYLRSDGSGVALTGGVVLANARAWAGDAQIVAADGFPGYPLTEEEEAEGVGEGVSAPRTLKATCMHMLSLLFDSRMLFVDVQGALNREVLFEYFQEEKAKVAQLTEAGHVYLTGVGKMYVEANAKVPTLIVLFPPKKGVRRVAEVKLVQLKQSAAKVCPLCTGPPLTFAATSQIHLSRAQGYSYGEEYAALYAHGHTSVKRALTGQVTVPYTAEAVSRWPLFATGAVMLTETTGCNFVTPAQRGGMRGGMRGGVWSPYEGLDDAEAAALRARAEAIKQRGSTDAAGHFVAAAGDAAAVAADSSLRSLIGSLIGSLWSPYEGLDDAEAVALRARAGAIWQRGSTDAAGHFVAAAGDAAALAADSRLRQLIGTKLGTPMGNTKTTKWTPTMDAKVVEIKEAYPSFTWPQVVAKFAEVLGDSLLTFDGQLNPISLKNRYQLLMSKPANEDKVNWAVPGLERRFCGAMNAYYSPDECVRSLKTTFGLIAEDPAYPEFRAAASLKQKWQRFHHHCVLQHCPAGAGKKLKKK